MTKERPRCGYCGKLIRLWSTIVRAPREGTNMIPVAGWQYSGNQKVVANRYANLLISPDGKEFKYRDGLHDYEIVNYEAEGWEHARRLSEVHVWDGESYLPVDGFFCSNVCSGNFAATAYRAGYRMKQKVKAA